MASDFVGTDEDPTGVTDAIVFYDTAFDPLLLYSFSPYDRLDWQAEGPDGVAAPVDTMRHIRVYRNIVADTTEGYGVAVDIHDAELFGAYGPIGVHVEDVWVVNNTLCECYLAAVVFSRVQRAGSTDYYSCGTFHDLGVYNNLFSKNSVRDYESADEEVPPAAGAALYNTLYLQQATTDPEEVWAQEMVLDHNVYQVFPFSNGGLMWILRWLNEPFDEFFTWSSFDITQIQEHCWRTTDGTCHGEASWGSPAPNVFDQSADIFAIDLEALHTPDRTNPDILYRNFRPDDLLIAKGHWTCPVLDKIAVGCDEPLFHFLTGVPIPSSPDFEYKDGIPSPYRPAWIGALEGTGSSHVISWETPFKTAHPIDKPFPAASL